MATFLENRKNIIEFFRELAMKTLAPGKEEFV